MPYFKSTLDIQREIFKLKLDGSCCDVKLSSDDCVSLTRVHLPILSSSPLWCSDHDLLGDSSDDEVCVILQDWSMSDLNDVAVVRQLYGLEAWPVNSQDNETIDGNNKHSSALNAPALKQLKELKVLKVLKALIA